MKVVLPSYYLALILWVGTERARFMRRTVVDIFLTVRIVFVVVIHLHERREMNEGGKGMYGVRPGLRPPEFKDPTLWKLRMHDRHDKHPKHP